MFRDLVGVSLYTGVYWGTGFLFADFLGSIMRGYSAFKILSAMGWPIAKFGVCAAILLYHAILWVKSRNLTPVKGVSVAEVARRRASMVVYDVRSHGYYEKGATRIPGSIRLEPNALHQEILNLPPDKEIVLY